ncbi:hypothetical protein GUITHDRAFT_118479 [Guillardia theta CCMP2712]|uniref:Uncharacterized protein n=1 Tax=Guillardia theta (strain CCMP2712) TaxID=905079 RepID=L1IHS1_GUITC|nr:hypothetical protein GUITHDRAFT_118479 [Guillardia theta CCMP2712]EKX35355.1 hypothetical protein GUITHDRAFT_118479 [Guillardia theta CCMP2712]|eukprot:XP_005822335.1 hypothetical protein GUITHDRAFT_118479 [Guillardia theta CCMP2712]
MVRSRLDENVWYDNEELRASAEDLPNLFYHPPIQNEDELAIWMSIAELQAKNERRFRALNRKLVVAVKRNDLDAAKQAIDQGASVHIPNSKGIPLVMLAAGSGHLIDVEDSYIELDRGQGSPAMIDFLVNMGASVHARRKWDEQNALMVACLRGDLDCILALLRNGADLADVEYRNMTEFFSAMVNLSDYDADARMMAGEASDRNYTEQEQRFISELKMIQAVIDFLYEQAGEKVSRVLRMKLLKEAAQLASKDEQNMVALVLQYELQELEAEDKRQMLITYNGSMGKLEDKKVMSDTRKRVEEKHLEGMYRDLGTIERPRRLSTVIDPFVSPVVQVEEMEEEEQGQNKKLRGATMEMIQSAVPSTEHSSSKLSKLKRELEKAERLGDTFKKELLLKKIRRLEGQQSTKGSNS